MHFTWAGDSGDARLFKQLLPGCKSNLMVDWSPRWDRC
ncbi:hypothetical protein SynBIOSU31_02125 [Synechococcus sp. BIOS-U3-1]|nr:hypothetical protein SynBIOSU31_02125 [Synechococcus sp. BIOS-U3-1]